MDETYSHIILHVNRRGLADLHEGWVPSFTDIHAVRWLAGLVRRSVVK